jgi:nucleotide-binding universal stress UspA family protein
MSGERSLLLCTNGAEESLPAIGYGVWLANLLRLPVRLLGIGESSHREAVAKETLEIAENDLVRCGIHTTVRMYRGNFLEILKREASAERDLIVIGPLGRPFWRRLLRGASIRHIMHAVECPVLRAPEHHDRLEKVLLCLGGLGYARSAEQWALYMAKAAGAKVTLLHVVEPITYEYPVALELQKHIGQVVSTDTPYGKHLREALTMAQETGLETTFRERQGGIVHEILAEIKEGGYDLVVLGSPESSQSLRQRYTPNVSAEIAESISLPALVVRTGQEPT